MAFDLQQERQQAHALLDLLPPAKLGAVRSVLQVMINGDDEELTEEDSLEKHGSTPMEDVLAEFGLTMADFKTTNRSG